MAVSYATPPQGFVDSIYGTSGSVGTGIVSIKTLVPQAVDRKYHKTVQAKNWWKLHGMIGPDTYNEGDQSQTAAGYPVILKTDLKSAPGDTIKMGLRSNLSTGYNTGKVGDGQIVDSEVGWDYKHKYVKIERWREAVMTVGGMNAQRNPFEPYEQTEIDLLSDWTSAVEDNGLTYALHYGHAPHLFRKFGHASLAPSANPNTLFGNDTTLDTTRTIADLTGAGADNVKGLTFELGSTYMKQNKFDLVSIGGDKFTVALISPAARLKLMRDSEFRDSLQYARERGITNPLFRYATFVYADCLIFEYDKIRSLLGGYNPAGLTATAGGADLAEAAYTGIGGDVSYTKLHHTIFLGANALALAEGPMKMGKRVEDDYQNIIGRDADNIWGASRMDFKNEGETTTTNQSSLTIVSTLI